MKNRLLFLLTLLTVVTAMLSSCAGKGVDAPLSGSKMTISVHWPARSRLIPEAANSIAVTVSSGGTAVSSQIIPRPTTDPATSTVTFNNLPPTLVTLTAKAFPSTDGSGVAQATGTTTVTLQSGVTAQASITMASTIDHVLVTSPKGTLSPGDSLALTATAYDASGSIVLTASDKWAWNADVPHVTLTPNGPSCSAQGATLGDSNITATENESGKSGSVKLSVTYATPPSYHAQIFEQFSTNVSSTGHIFHDLNNLGDIAGAQGGVPEIVHADGSVTTPSLPQLGGDIQFISDTGSFIFVLPGDISPYLRSSGTDTHLTLTGADHLYAVGLTNGDVVAAEWSSFGNGSGAMYWNPSTQAFVPLPNTGDGTGGITGCSNNRYISFYHDIALDVREPRLFDLQANSYLVLNTTTSGSWQPDGANDAGFSFGQGPTGPIYWSSTTAQPVSITPTFYIAHANNKGQVVGTDGGTAKFWSEQTGVLDIGVASDLTAPWHIISVSRINDSGVILGVVDDGNGHNASVLLTPK